MIIYIKQFLTYFIYGNSMVMLANHAFLSKQIFKSVKKDVALHCYIYMNINSVFKTNGQGCCRLPSV